MKKHFTAHLIVVGAVLVSAVASRQAWGLGFGHVVSDAVLGQSLSFSVPVHVDAGERFGADCASAEVYYGEARLLQNMVQTAVERGSSENDWVVRITASSPIEEPVVEVSLSAGCERRFVRRFTVFADPPSIPVRGATLAQAPSLAPVDGSTVLTPLPRSMDGASGGGDAGFAARNGNGGGGSTAGSAGRHPARGGARASASLPPDRPRIVRKGPTLALATEMRSPAPEPVLPAREADPAGTRKVGPRIASTVVMAPRLVLDGGYAHLKLDMEDPILPAATGASGAAALALSLSEVDDPEARQLRLLQQNIQTLRLAGQADRDQTAKLEAQLSSAQSHNDWLPYVLGLLALAIAAAAALAWKLRRQSRLAHSAWFNESQQHMPAAAIAPAVPIAAPVPRAVVNPVESDAGPSIGGELVDEPLVAESGGAAGHAPGVDVTATSPLDRAALAGVLAHDPSPARELSVEELLDLEQQADFFIALGQEDAAVDLLMSHLRSAGGQSPLPYTKLLEIYRRQGDRNAYERTRARFNRRFNAYAPDWDTGPASGRSLDDYPETVVQIQGTWQSPLDAMALLESLLFKRDDTSELFDLPAYRDVLVLYSLARDLWQQNGGNAGTQVDILLPLDDLGQVMAFKVPESAATPTRAADLDLPVDLDSPMSFEMTGFEPIGLPGNLDLDLPDIVRSYGAGRLGSSGADEDVHMSSGQVSHHSGDLAELSLVSVETTNPSLSGLDWDESLPSVDPTPPPER